MPPAPSCSSISYRFPSTLPTRSDSSGLRALPAPAGTDGEPPVAAPSVIVWSGFWKKGAPADGVVTPPGDTGNGVLHFLQAISSDGLANPHWGQSMGFLLGEQSDGHYT